jgi:NADPH:quinone reductase
VKALLCKAYGPPDTLVLEELPSPVPKAGQVLVRVQAAGVNFPDTLIIEGKYQFKPEPPFAPGSELAGTVLAVGDGVTHVKPGQPVAAMTTWGAFAEEVAIDAARVVPLPPGTDPKLAAAFGLTYGTSYYALKDRAALQAGETLLVLGAAGGVGLAAVELGKMMGARVIAAASSEEKLATCRRYGADVTINYESEDLREGIKRATEGRGVDVVYDPVGGRYSEPAFRSIAWKGRHLVVGFAAGEIPKLPLNLALLKGASIVGVFWGDFTKREPKLNAANLGELMKLVLAGKLKPLVSATYPLAKGAQALNDLAARKVQGKAVVVMG